MILRAIAGADGFECAAPRVVAAKALSQGHSVQRPIPREPTEAMVIAGFECDAWDELDALYRHHNGPSCAQAANAVRGIYEAMMQELESREPHMEGNGP